MSRQGMKRQAGRKGERRETTARWHELRIAARLARRESGRAPVRHGMHAAISLSICTRSPWTEARPNGSGPDTGGGRFRPESRVRTCATRVGGPGAYAHLWPRQRCCCAFRTLLSAAQLEARLMAPLAALGGVLPTDRWAGSSVGGPATASRRDGRTARRHHTGILRRLGELMR